jgi:hypothetical protein
MDFAFYRLLLLIFFTVGQAPTSDSSNPVGILSNPMYCKAYGVFVQIARCVEFPISRRTACAAFDIRLHAAPLHRGLASIRLDHRPAYRLDGFVQIVERRRDIVLEKIDQLRHLRIEVPASWI